MEITGTALLWCSTQNKTVNSETVHNGIPITFQELISPINAMKQVLSSLLIVVKVAN